MKILSRICAVVLTLTLAMQVLGTASAAGFKNYVTASISEEEQEQFFTNLRNFELITKADEYHSIDCFALSEGGLIALGFDTSDDAIIYVYNEDGEFLYGYRFLNNHCAFAIFFEGENLSVYWGKTEYIGSFDSGGNCLQLRKVVTSPKNSDAYYNDRYRPASGKIGERQYYADRGLGISTKYIRFTVVDNQGAEQVIYDVSEEHNSSAVIYCVILLLISLFIVLIKKKVLNRH